MTQFHRRQVTVLRMSNSERAEENMAEVRVRLGQAVMCEQRGEDELAEKYAAVGANKIAIAIRLAERAAVVVPIRTEAA